ncbi:MAG TPA: DUF5320 domain-containing protein [Desulfomonilia bacterium]
MPRGDGTGPNGMGPMTGGGWGNCSTNQPFINSELPFKKGFGAGRGGRGRRNCFHATGIPGWMRRNSGFSYIEDETDISMLKNMETFIEKQLERLRKRINELEKS